jgi:hypothetical protein
VAITTAHSEHYSRPASPSVKPPTWLIALLVGVIPIASAVAYLTSTSGLSLTNLVDHPLEAGLCAGVLGIALSCTWLYSIIRGPAATLTRRGVLLGYLALWSLGLFSLMMLEYYQELNYPIAQYTVLPTIPMIHRLILWDTVGALALAYGLWLGSILARRSAASTSSPATRITSQPSTQAGSATLARWGPRLFLVGLAGSAVLVGITHSIALFASNIDTVRYTQGVGLGFVTLAQYELIGAGVIGLALAVSTTEHRGMGIALVFLSALVLTATRAGRTPILVMAFAALILVRLMGRQPRIVPVFLTTAALLAGVLYLGVFRLESESGPLPAKEKQIRALFDISPEVREQTFVFNLFPSQAPYLGTHGILPIGLAILPGKLLTLAHIDKQALSQDSSHLYTATMNDLHIYRNTKPIRVGLAGELWMDAGPLGLIIGMVLYGIGGAWLTAWRPKTPLRLVARALASALFILALITPLAVLSAIALVTLLPFLLAREDSSVDMDYELALLNP